MGYAKLFSSITESSLWSEPKEVRLLFVTMLARANSIGFVEASVPGLARVANLTLPEVETALGTLLNPDPHSKDLDEHPENEGRRLVKVPGGWVILNYEEYRNRESDADRREYMKEYMKEYRARKKACKQIVNESKPDVKSGKESPYASASASEGKEVGECRGEGDVTSGNSAVTDGNAWAALPAALDTPKFREAWETFLAYRKRKRFKELLPESVAAQWKILAEHGPDVARLAIEQTIANDWRGLFPEKIATGAGSARLSYREAEHARAAAIHTKPSKFKDAHGTPL